MQPRTTRKCTLVAALAAFFSGVVQLHSQGTAFTYQGRLNEGSVPAYGRYDLTFALYVDSTVGTAVSGIITNTGTPVANGLFTVMLDFGAGAFDGRPRWLEIGVQRAGGPTGRFWHHGRHWLRLPMHCTQARPRKQHRHQVRCRPVLPSMQATPTTPSTRHRQARQPTCSGA